MNKPPVPLHVLGRTPACLDVETMSALADGSLNSVSAAAARSHLDECTFCQTELAMFRVFLSESPRPDERMAVEHITNLIRESIQPLIGFKRESEERAHGRFAWLFSFKMYTAMGAVAAVIAVFVIVTREKEPPRIVNVPEAQVWRSLEVSGLSPSGPLATAPNRMQWSPFKGAASYEVRILAVDETLIWQGSSQTTSIALPLEIRTRLTSRRTFLWQVTALDSAGRRLSASNLQRIHIE